KSEYNEFMSTLVSVTDAPYIGTTALPPSTFLELFPWVLQRKAVPETRRIVIADKERLRRDRTANPAGYMNFVETQRATGIELFCMHPQEFEAISRESRVGLFVTLWLGRHGIELEPDPERRIITARSILPADVADFEQLHRHADM